MKLERIRVGLVALMALSVSVSMTGCGGGSDTGGEGGGVTRQLLAGDGTASGDGVTTKVWRVAALSGNHNYGDQSSACPAKFTSITDDSETLECGEDDRVTISSDGTFTFQGWGKTWVLNGNRATLDYGTVLGTQVVEVIPEVVGGRQRLRLLQVNFTRRGEVRPHDDGSTVVLEEVPVM